MSYPPLMMQLLKALIKQVYHIQETKPRHIFFDNNCTLAWSMQSDQFFDNIKLTVDVFHFKSKHAKTDEFCQHYCNPAGHPELLGENGNAWYFNSSIAEQTNVWLGGYHSICQEITAVRYDFYLDQMVAQWNAMTLDKIHTNGSQSRNTYVRRSVV